MTIPGWLSVPRHAGLPEEQLLALGRPEMLLEQFDRDLTLHHAVVGRPDLPIPPRPRNRSNSYLPAITRCATGSPAFQDLHTFSRTGLQQDDDSTVSPVVA